MAQRGSTFFVGGRGGDFSSLPPDGPSYSFTLLSNGTKEWTDNNVWGDHLIADTEVGTRSGLAAGLRTYFGNCGKKGMSA